MKTNVLSQIQRENKIKALAKETLYNSTAQSILCFLETKNVLLKLVLFIFLAFASGFTSLLVIKSILSYLSFEVFTTTITYFEVDLASLNALDYLKAKHEIIIDVLTKSGDSILDKSTLTFKDTNESLLIIFFNSVLSFFDMDTGKLISTKDLSQHDLNNKEYFLSPTNLITSKLDSIESLFNTHNFIALK